MKKLLTAIIAIILVWMIQTPESSACTNLIVTRGASANGSVMITYSADSHVLYGELYHWPSRDYPECAMLDVYEWDTGSSRV